MAATLAPLRAYASPNPSITEPRYAIPSVRIHQYRSELGKAFTLCREERQMSVEQVSHHAQVRTELITLLEGGKPSEKFGSVEAVARLAAFYGRRLEFWDSRRQYECTDELLRMDAIAAAGVRVTMRGN